MKKKFELHSLKIAGLPCLVVLLGIFFYSCSSTSQENKPIKNIEKYREMRVEKLNQPRSLIHNNDGDDSVFPSKKRTFIAGTQNQPRPQADSIGVDWSFSIPNFLTIRSEGLIGSDVTTISYNTSRPFGVVLHNTKVGEVLTWEYGLPGRRNSVPDFLKLGTDQLEVTADFAHENGFEFIWSHRVNDTHDASHRSDNPSYYFRKFKEEHPEYLFGEIGERLPHGRWSAVDFSHDEIRDMTVQYFTEVCENYDVDGIELDFFRHMFLFGSVARGDIATEEQLDMITEMITRIREMTERVGMKKGKPILVLARVPDSFEYCRRVGIDLEKWMQQGLLDIVIGSDYFRLNTWDHLIKTCHQYGVKFYAGLSESRVRDEHPSLQRLQNAVYRARAAAAWEQGVDGLYSFNEYNSRSQYLREIGNADKLTDKNNLYFITYRNGNPNAYLQNGDEYASLPLLSPVNPVAVSSEPLQFMVEIGDESKPCDAFLIVYAENADPGSLQADINGVRLSYRKSTADGLIIYNVPQESVKAGKSELTFRYNKGQEEINLLDAAILFYRNSDDAELNQLADLVL